MELNREEIFCMAVLASLAAMSLARASDGHMRILLVIILLIAIALIVAGAVIAVMTWNKMRKAVDTSSNQTRR
jgi:heme O synthase-like polyprenyltransferase